MGLFSLHQATAQPVFSFTGSASYVRLGSHEGPALSFGGRLALPIGPEARGGWLVGGTWSEVALVQTDPDRYERVPIFGFFSTEACVERATRDPVSDTLCEERIPLTSQSLEALYARTGRSFSYALGAGLRYGEEIDRSEYDGIEERTRPYGTALLEVPIFSGTSVLLQMRAGKELLQVQAGAIFRPY